MVSSSMISVKSLSKVYKDGNSKVTALDKVTFSINKKESVAIVGPSGSGKTTLLEIMGGLNAPTQGVVEIDGVNVHKGYDKEISNFRNKTLGFVFQLMHLQDYFTARENITLPLIAAGMGSVKAYQRADELLEIVDLRHRASHYPKQLSGGEMQRVAVARALANNPKVIMADEPTGKLDKKNSDKVMDILMKISKSGVNLILITHDEKIAKRFKRIIQLEHGRIVN